MNINNHNFLIEEIRKKVSILQTANWTIEFSWVKAHAGKYGNERADQQTKAGARNRGATICYNRISKGTLKSEVEEETKKQMAKRVE
jgi:ribonuclease HI